MREIGTLRATWPGLETRCGLVSERLQKKPGATPALDPPGNGSRPIYMLASLFSRNHPRETASHPRLNAGSKSPQIEVRLTANYLTQS